MDIRKFLARLGPGFVSGAADDDPSGIATYAQTGAQFGYTQLWLALYATPLMAVVQEMCGRIGLVTGGGLATAIKKHYPRPVLVTAVGLLFFANAINIGADLGAMASTMQLFFTVPFWAWVVGFGVLSLVLEIFLTYKTYAKYLKWLAFSLLAYVVAAVLVHQDWDAIVFATLIPTVRWDAPFMLNVVAVLGTTISPYLFFWESDQEVEEEDVRGVLHTDGSAPTVTDADVKEVREDTWYGMAFSNVVMFFIIITAVATLRAQGITTVNTAAEAAQALRPFAGDLAYFVFALGILGTGLLAVPILAGSAAYAAAEATDMPRGLNRTWADAPGFYGVMGLATVAGLGINFLGIPPFKMLYYAAIINGLVAPPLLLLIVQLAGDKTVMGDRASSRTASIIGWCTTLLMAAAGVTIVVNALQ